MSRPLFSEQESLAIISLTSPLLQTATQAVVLLSLVLTILTMLAFCFGVALEHTTEFKFLVMVINLSTKLSFAKIL